MPSPYSLPLHALRLAGKCALPLILWFSAGELLRWGLLYAATELSHGSWWQARLVVTLVLVTLVILLSMTIVTGMFLSLRRVLWEGRARAADGQEDEKFWVSLNRVAPAFAVIYLAWELYLKDAGDFYQMDMFHNLDDELYVPLLNNIANGTDDKVTYGLGLVGLDWKVSLGAMVVTFGLRMLFGKMVEKGSGRYAGIAAAFAEFSFMFCGLNAIFTFTKLRGDWAEHRQVVGGATDAWKHAKENIPGWEAFWNWAGDVWPHVVDALAVPLTWLAVAVLIFGGTIDDARRALRGTRLESGVDRLEKSHDVTQRATDRLIGGFVERWVPVANAFRITIRGGAILFGLMCLLYVGLHVGGDYLDRTVRTLIGSDVPFMWLVVSWPVSFLKDLLVTCLSYCVLAAAFDIAATRARLRGEDITA
ncbi:MAG: hypothetical protein HOV96_20820 [Nonomuraea sp.]|nr:hypothetical protein [Nonomuraea sp.]NUP79984.1 hypothetical protein [Nonomuraea sp.]NUT09081.1 hypothetical protein [Nonomuraea sp.]